MRITQLHFSPRRPSLQVEARDQDALVLREKTLEFMRRVTQNNPEKGESKLPPVQMVCDLLFPGDAMFNLSVSYSSIGRHQDALALLEQTLELRRRVLPGNDLKIGATFL